MKKIILSLLTFMLVAVYANAKIKVTGKVTDKADKGIPGVIVTVKNTTMGALTDIKGNYTKADKEIPGVIITVKNATLGTVTDIEGKYTIEAPKKGDTLVFSMVGVASVEKVYNGKNLINVQLDTVFNTNKSNKIMVFDKWGEKIFEKNNITLPKGEIQFSDLMTSEECGKIKDDKYFFVFADGKEQKTGYLIKGNSEDVKYTIPKMLYASKNIKDKQIFIEIDGEKTRVKDGITLKGAKIKLKNNRVKIVGKMPYKKSATLIIDDKEIPLYYRIDDDNAEECFTMKMHSNDEDKETIIIMQKNSTNDNFVIEGKTEAPLYIIDGVPTSAEKMKEISADSIKTITVLKNKVATTLYGERAKNGVLIITTKK